MSTKTEDIRNRHGAFSWGELVCPDPAKAAEFYAKICGWTTETMNMGEGDYTVFMADGEPVGGVMAPTASMPEGIPPHWGLYITVEDVDKALAAATENGAEIIMPAMDMPKVGRMAHIRDPQGACIALITYEGKFGDEC